jgi:hypothetical protein
MSCQDASATVEDILEGITNVMVKRGHEDSVILVTNMAISETLQGSILQNSVTDEKFSDKIKSHLISVLGGAPYLVPLIGLTLEGKVDLY